MTFKENLEQMPDVSHLDRVEILDETGHLLHSIPNATGKMGSLRLYNALAVKFEGVLNAQAAEQGLIWFAEHVEDAIEHPGKHPNVDLLLEVREENVSWRVIAYQK